MRKNKRKILSILLTALSIISIEISGYAHSGRTDSNGGHKDNKNKSGLGSYHYHCGGYPAHLHENGVCPYKGSSSSSSKSSTSGSSTSKSSSSKSSTSSSSTSKSSSSKSSTTTSSSTSRTTSTVPTTILATNIKINENIEKMEVGESEKLTTTITPDNVTDKNVTWKSSDESIATISATGEIMAKKSGEVNITASTANGKINTIKITVKEEQKVDNNNVVTEITTTNSNNILNNTTNNNSEESNPIGGVLTLGLLGCGGYFGYKKYKK